MTDLTGDLLREVSRVQHDKTIQAVRDLMETVALSAPKKYSSSRSYDPWEDRTAKQFKEDLIALLDQLRAEGRNG